MADPETSQDASSYAGFSKEYAELDPIIVAFHHWALRRMRLPAPESC